MEVALERIVRKIDPQARVLRAWPLEGGVSAQVMALEVERAGGQVEKMVLRRHGAGDLKRNPDVAVHEFTLLKCLKGEGLAVPAPHLLDLSGEIFPSPFIVMEYVEGKTESDPSNPKDVVSQLLRHLVQIHAVDYTTLGLTFLPEKTKDVARKLSNHPARLDTALDEERIRDALARLWPFEQRNPSVLLHGDFWLGNTLWDEGRLVAVIDWENAGLGDPLADLGNARLELLWTLGAEAMTDFTHRYAAMTNVDMTALPQWELFNALRYANNLTTWSLGETIERKMIQAHRWFVGQALEKLSL